MTVSSLAVVAVVFDVLGTLVDEPAGIRAAIAAGDRFDLHVRGLDDLADQL